MAYDQEAVLRMRAILFLCLQGLSICAPCRSIVDFAKAFKEKKLPLHTLVNNAGVFTILQASFLPKKICCSNGIRVRRFWPLC